MVVLVGVLWLVLGVLLALRFRDDKTLSTYELTRRSGNGDQAARDTLRYQQHGVELESLRLIVVTLFSSATVTSSVFAFGVWQGIIIGTLLLILAPLLVRLSPIRGLSDKLRDRTREYALKVVEAIGPLLRLLRKRDHVSGAIRIYSREELSDLLHHSPGVLTSEQQKRLNASLAFDEKTVTDIMTPRSVIDTADVHDTLGPLVLDDLHKTGHSRFPVIEGDIDHVVGILYIKELIDLKSEHQTVRAAMNKKVFYIHEHQSLAHALHGLLRSHHHLFIVVNEYRDTVGVLTLEDVIEALIGSKIIDEFDEFDDLRAVAESNPRRNNTTPKAHDV